MNQPSPSTELEQFLDWQSFNETRTDLSPEHLQRAARLSQAIRLSQQRWQVYLCALGVLGFEQWLTERAPDLEIHSDRSTIWQPAYANLIAAACHIRVGSFKICLITSSSISDQHSVPFAVLDLPDFAAHFYVKMQVEEEEQHVAVSGFINYEQYRHYQQTSQLQVEPDWTYTLPQAWFNPDPDTLVLNLRCLEPDAIQLPITTANISPDNITALQQKLVTLKSQLPNQYLWQLLTVTEGTILLSNPDLVNWIYKATAPSLAQPLINVGLWLRNQIDTTAQELGWMLMPLPASSEMRSLQQDFNQIRDGLKQQKIHIPPTARGAYRNLDSQQGSVRLYAITWILSETSQYPEWMLLIALGPQPQAQMPKTLKLEIRDESEILFEDSLENTTQGILYAQVIGNWGDRFWVTLTADNKAVFEIPPFGLELETTA